MRKTALLFLVGFFIFAGKANALQQDSFITNANPVRGSEGWESGSVDPLDLPSLQYSVATQSGMPVSWLLRYDAVQDASVSAYFKNVTDLNTTQTLGALLEITPNLAKDAGIQYTKVLLSGYYPVDRLKLIDTYMKSFKLRFGFLPKSVSALHLDSYSLNFLQEKYSILVALIGSEQYSPNGDRLWGGYVGGPYLPSKTNILVPAQSSEDRIDVVVIRSTPIDLLNFYDSNHLTSRHPIYNLTRLVEQYSQKDFNEFTHLNFGLDNHASRKLYGPILTDSYKKIVNLKQSLGLQFVSLETLGNFVLNRYPESSPAFFYVVNNPVGNPDNKFYWYENPYYRIGLKTEEGVTSIIDFRAYNSNLFEDHFSTPDTASRFSLEIPEIIDSLKYPGSEISLGINLDNAKISHQNWRVTFASGDKSLTLNPQSISFMNLNPIVTSKDLSISHKESETVWHITPSAPYKSKASHLSILIIVFVPLIIISLIYNRVLFLGIVFAFLSTFTVIRSGDLYPFGLGVWGPNGHDAIFHLSLIEKFIQSPFNLDHPQLSGAILSNYHFLFDYISAISAKLFSLSSLTTYFVIFPITISLAIVGLLYLLFKRWQMTRLESSLSYFFVFLAGSFGYIPALLSGKNPLYSESTFWANQSISILLNPPYALSIVILLIFLLLLDKYRKPNYWQLILLGVTGGVLSQTKVYAFILLCVALLFTRKFKELLVVALTGVLLSLPFSSMRNSPFVFSPLWFIKSMFASFDRLGWPRLVQAWQAYEAGGVWPKLIAINILGLIVFLLGNLATRVISLRYLLSKRLENTSEKVVLYIVTVGIILPLVFIQDINPWNTIQFLYYSIFFLGIFTARGVILIFYSLKSSFLRILFLLLVLFLSVITSFGTLQNYLGFYSSSRISYTELNGLDKLSRQPKGTVLSPLFSDKNSSGIPTPKPLYSYTSTSYISAFSGQPEFLSDTINLDITGFNYNERRRQVERFYHTEDKDWAKEFLQNNNIKYIYETPLQKMKLIPEDISLTKIFDSGEVSIYKLN